jgi:hypothetical protein
VALPVAAGRQGVDRDHLVAGCDQGSHQQAPVGLDPDHHLGRVAGVASDELVQPGQARQSIGDPLGGQHLAVDGHQAHVMMALGPIDPDQQHRPFSLLV